MSTGKSKHSSKPVAKAALIEDLQNLAAKSTKGLPVTRNFYRAKGKFTESDWQRHFPTFGAFIAAAGVNKPVVKAEKEEPEVTFGDVRRVLKRGPLSTEDLAASLNATPAQVKTVIADAKERGGLLLTTVNDLHDLGDGILLEPGNSEVKGSHGEWTHVFGFTTDNHLCNKHSRLDVLNAAYDHFEREGITTVYNAGNWIDGEARFNKTELVTAPGLDHQLDYMIDVFPQRNGIKTHYIAGDDHEGWYSQREGIEIGRYLRLELGC